MAHAMAACRIPYVVSFVLQRDGRLLDGIPLHQAVATIDEAASPRPLFYMANCVHPRVFETALASEISRARSVHERVIGLQANTSTRSPEELEGLRRAGCGRGARGARRRDAPAATGAFGTKILGGCCGTDDRHIAWIARRAREYHQADSVGWAAPSGKESGMTDSTVGALTKALAAICSRCPVCNHARAHPESWLGRVLHHPLHADHCPFWKAERDDRRSARDPTAVTRRPPRRRA